MFDMGCMVKSLGLLVRSVMTTSSISSCIGRCAHIAVSGPTEISIYCYNINSNNEFCCLSLFQISIREVFCNVDVMILVIFVLAASKLVINVEFAAKNDLI